MLTSRIGNMRFFFSLFAMFFLLVFKSTLIKEGKNIFFSLTSVLMSRKFPPSENLLILLKIEVVNVKGLL